jgi:hypothetical protein
VVARCGRAARKLFLAPAVLHRAARVGCHTRIFVVAVLPAGYPTAVVLLDVTGFAEQLYSTENRLARIERFDDRPPRLGPFWSAAHDLGDFELRAAKEREQ